MVDYKCYVCNRNIDPKHRFLGCPYCGGSIHEKTTENDLAAVAYEICRRMDNNDSKRLQALVADMMYEHPMERNLLKLILSEICNSGESFLQETSFLINRYSRVMEQQWGIDKNRTVPLIEILCKAAKWCNKNTSGNINNFLGELQLKGKMDNLLIHLEKRMYDLEAHCQLVQILYDEFLDSMNKGIAYQERLQLEKEFQFLERLLEEPYQIINLRLMNAEYLFLNGKIRKAHECYTDLMEYMSVEHVRGDLVSVLTGYDYEKDEAETWITETLNQVSVNLCFLNRFIDSENTTLGEIQADGMIEKLLGQKDYRTARLGNADYIKWLKDKETSCYFLLCFDGEFVNGKIMHLVPIKIKKTDEELVISHPWSVFQDELLRETPMYSIKVETCPLESEKIEVDEKTKRFIMRYILECEKQNEICDYSNSQMVHKIEKIIVDQVSRVDNNAN